MGAQGNVTLHESELLFFFNCSSLHNFQEHPACTRYSPSRVLADARIQSEWDISPFSQLQESRTRS